LAGDSPIRPPGNPAGKRISIALAVAVHLLLAAFLFYGVSWQTKSPDAVEVELVRATPEPPAPPVAVPPAPTPEPPPPAPEPKPTPPPPKPEIAIKEKEKPKPPPPKPVPAAAPRVDPFQEQLKREAEQLTQRKQAESAAQELAQVKASQAAAARNKADCRLPRPHPRQDPRQHRVAARHQGQSGGGVRGHAAAQRRSDQRPAEKILRKRRARLRVERAILKSSPLPRPEQSDVFDRLLNIPYRPRED
jgi:colicin import membrane protein